jgi:hypothetical protein
MQSFTFYILNQRVHHLWALKVYYSANEPIKCLRPSNYILFWQEIQFTDHVCRGWTMEWDVWTPIPVSLGLTHTHTPNQNLQNSCYQICIHELGMFTNKIRFLLKITTILNRRPCRSYRNLKDSIHSALRKIMNAPWANGQDTRHKSYAKISKHLAVTSTIPIFGFASHQCEKHNQLHAHNQELKK